MDRRALLTATGTLASSSFAGCLGLTSVTEDEPEVPMDATLSGWPTYRGDVQRTGRASAGPSDPSGLDAKWRVTGESTYHAHLAAADGYVFTDADGLHVIDGETGSITWSSAEAGWANSHIVCSGGVIASMGLDIVRYE